MCPPFASLIIPRHTRESAGVAGMLGTILMIFRICRDTQIDDPIVRPDSIYVVD
jgi:hypothetical protein